MHDNASKKRVSKSRLPAWLVGALLFGSVVFAVLHFADVQRFALMVRGAQPLWLLAALALQLTTYASVALGWSRVLAKAGSPQPLRRLFPIAISKLFADQVLPGAGIGGNIVLVNQLGALGVPRGVAIAALLVSMIGFYAAYALLALVMLTLVWFHGKATPLLAGLVTLFLIVAIAIPGMALWLRQRGSRPLPPRLENIPFVRSLLRAIAEAPKQLVMDHKLLVTLAGFNGLVFLADAATLEVCFLALGYRAAFGTAFIALLAASIMVTLAPLPLGLGSFEAGSTAMLSLLGVPLEMALAATLLLRGFTLWLPLVPGLLLLNKKPLRT